MEQIQENKMGTQPILPLILKMSIPAMFSMLVQSLYNVVDSYFVAKISEQALTAVSLANPAQTLMISFAVGTGVGVNSLVSRRLGQHNQKEADAAATHGVILAVLTWLVFLLLGLFASGPFISSTTTNPEIAKLGTQYLTIVLAASVGCFVEIAFEKTLQATGNMIWPMIFQLTGAVINIIFDPILIFGLLGFPAMGVIGAAVATVFGQIMSMILSIVVMFVGEHKVTVSLRGFRFSGRIVRDIYAVGLPSILMQSIGSVLNGVMNQILISFNETAVAVYGIYFKVQSFIYMPVFGLTHGVMPIMGYNFGAAKRKRLLSALFWGCVIATLIMVVGVIIFAGFPQMVLGIFSASDHMLEMGVPAFRTIAICFIPSAFGIMFSTLFQAIGKGSSSLIISVLRQLVLIIPAALILSQFGLMYVWFAFPIAEGVSLIFSILLYLRAKHTLIDVVTH
jgi:putative MATE family efflux protein